MARARTDGYDDPYRDQIIAGLEDDPFGTGTLNPPSDQPGQAVPDPTTDPFAGVTPPSSYAGKYPTIADAYKTYLGRTPSDAELMGATGGGSWAVNDPRIINSINAIRYSPEATAYAAKPAAPPPPAAPTTPTSGLTAAPTTNLEGFDATKLADTSHQTPKYIFARLAQQYGADPQMLLQALRADPSGYFKNATLDGDILGNLTDPAFNGVSAFDVYRDFGGDNAVQWLAQNGPGMAGGAGTGSGAGGATGAGLNPTGTGAVGNASAGTTLDSPLNDLLRAQLMKYMSVDPNSASIDDPALHNASEAYRRAQERTMGDRRNSAAERLAAQGLADSGAMDSAVERGYQDLANATSQYDAGLVLDQRNRQMQELQNLLQIGAGVLSRDQETLLRQKLMDLQNQQFNDQLGFQIGKTDAELNNDLMRILLGGSY